MNNRQNICDVTCIGQAVLDCITRGREAEPYKPNVYRADSIRLSTGGDAANEAFVLAGFGRKARLVCGLGNDLAGKVILSEVGRRGVDTSYICIKDDITTPVANIIVNTDGSRMSVNSRATMLKGYVPEKSCVSGSRIVSFASLFRAPLDQAETVRALIRAAKEGGAIVCADTKLPTFSIMTLESLRDVLPLIDYFFPNEQEAAFYTGRKDLFEMADVFRNFGIRHVVIKTGKDGCCMSSEDGTFLLPALDVPVVDSTGAGDNFAAGFYDALLQGADFRECGEAGIRQAAESLGHAGAVI